MPPQRPLAPNYGENVYIAVTLTPNSAYMYSPIVLPDYPSVMHVGNVGELQNVKLLSVPKNDWLAIRSDVLRMLCGDKTNIEDVEVQVPKLRTRRA